MSFSKKGKGPPDRIETVLESSAPVFLQIAGVPGASAGWKRTLGALGLPGKVFEDSFNWDELGSSPIPRTISYKYPDGSSHELHYRGVYLG